MRINIVGAITDSGLHLLLPPKEVQCSLCSEALEKLVKTYMVREIISSPNGDPDNQISLWASAATAALSLSLLLQSLAGCQMKITSNVLEYNYVLRCWLALFKVQVSSLAELYFLILSWLLDKISLLSSCTRTEFLNILRSCLCLHLCLFLSAKTAVISSSSACHPEIQVHFSVRWGCVILWYQNYFEEFCQHFAFCSRTWEEDVPVQSSVILISWFLFLTWFQFPSVFILPLGN